jgi:hypothetical protein
VLFDTANNWIIRLAEAHQAGRLEAELKKIRRHKLIIMRPKGRFDASRYEERLPIGGQFSVAGGAAVLYGAGVAAMRMV